MDRDASKMRYPVYGIDLILICTSLKGSLLSTVLSISSSPFGDVIATNLARESGRVTTGVLAHVNSHHSVFQSPAPWTTIYDYDGHHHHYYDASTILVCTRIQSVIHIDSTPYSILDGPSDPPIARHSPTFPRQPLPFTQILHIPSPLRSRPSLSYGVVVEGKTSSSPLPASSCTPQLLPASSQSSDPHNNEHTEHCNGLGEKLDRALPIQESCPVPPLPP
jgi:hypothetical protein